MVGGLGHEAVQLIGPERREKSAQPQHSALVEPVIPLASLFAGGDQTHLGEDGKVLRYRRTGDRKLRRELRDGAFARCQELQ
jgi:hypothetical protein